MKNVPVSLTWGELGFAMWIGAVRQLQNLKAGRTDAHGRGADDGWTAHIEGAAGEMALAKAMGVYWSGALGNLKADDVGPLQVRTRSSHSYDLIVHKTDPDDRAFVLLTGRAPHFIARGWIRGDDAKREEWWADPAKGRPAYFVPQAELHPIEDILGEVRP